MYYRTFYYSFMGCLAGCCRKNNLVFSVRAHALLSVTARGREPQRKDEEGSHLQHEPPQPRGPRAQNCREASECREEGQRVKRQVIQQPVTLDGSYILVLIIKKKACTWASGLKNSSVFFFFQICSDGLTWKPTFGALASDFKRQKMMEVPSGSSGGWLFWNNSQWPGFGVIRSLDLRVRSTPEQVDAERIDERVLDSHDVLFSWWFWANISFITLVRNKDMSPDLFEK